MKYLKLSNYQIAIIFLLFHFIAHIVHSAFLKKIGIVGVFTTHELIYARSIFTVIVLVPFFFLKKISFLPKGSFKRDIWLNLIIAGLSILSSYCWHYGLRTVEVNNAVTVSFLLPICTSIWAAIFLKEKISKILVISLLVCVSMIVYVYNPKVIVNFGYIFLFVDIFAYSLSIVLSRKLLINNQHPVSILLFKTILICLVSFGTFPKLAYKISLDYSVSYSMIAFSALYVLETLFFLISIKLAPCVTYLQPIMYTRFVFGVFFSYFLLGEILSIKQLIVVIVIIFVNVIFLVLTKNFGKIKKLIVK